MELDPIRTNRCGDSPIPYDSTLVTEALDGLPERYRMPVWLHHSEGFSWGEVAAALCLGERQARRYGTKGMRLLHGHLVKRGMPVSMQTIELVLHPIQSEGAPERLLRGLEGLVRYGTGEHGAMPGRRLEEEENGVAGAWREAGVWIAFLAGAAMLMASGEIRRAVTDAVIGWLGG